MEAIIFLFATAGGTFIVVFSTIFESFRRLFDLEDEIVEAITTNQIKASKKQRLQIFFAQLFGCPLCFGFWMGAVLFMFMYDIADYNPLVHFSMACAGSAASYLFYKIVK